MNRALLIIAAALIAVPQTGVGVNGAAFSPKVAHHSRASNTVAAPAPTPGPATSAPRPRPDAMPVGAPRASRTRRTPPRRVRLLTVTCYLPTGHRTASGTWPQPGTAAGNRWPFGTRLLVERIGQVVITDRIGHGSQLDLFMTNPHACRRFGRQHLLVQEVHP